MAHMHDLRQKSRQACTLLYYLKNHLCSLGKSNVHIEKKDTLPYDHQRQ